MGSVANANAEAKANANTSYLNLILKHGIIILKKNSSSIISFIYMIIVFIYILN